MEFSDFGDFKDRITNNYWTNVHAEEEFSKIYSTLYNWASKPQFEQLSSSVYDLKLESLAKLGIVQFLSFRVSWRNEEISWRKW